MSRLDYDMCLQIVKSRWNWRACVLAAYELADTNIGGKLRAVFPDIVDEFLQRKSSPGGFLASEINELPHDHPIRRTLKAKGLL